MVKKIKSMLCEDILQEGINYLRTKKYCRVITILDTMIATCADDGFMLNLVYSARSKIHEELGNHDLALSDIKKAYKSWHSGSDGIYTRLRIHKKQGKYDLAIADCTKIIELLTREYEKEKDYTTGSPLENIYEERGDLYTLKGCSDLAQNDYSKASEVRMAYMDFFSDEGDIVTSPDARLLYFHDSDTISKQLKNYDVNTLEQLAVELYARSCCLASLEEETAWIIDMIIAERGCKLNRNFTWTDRNAQELLRVNDLLMSSFEKAFEYADNVIDELEAQKTSNDCVKDYNVEVKLTPYIKGYDCFDDCYKPCFEEVLCNPIGQNNKSILSCYHAGKTDKTRLIYMNKSNNWNDDEYFGHIDYFKDHYISYALHALLDNIWCFHDIIRIDRVCTDVTVRISGVYGGISRIKNGDKIHSEVSNA